MEFLAGIFGVDCFPKRRKKGSSKGPKKDGSPEEPSKSEIDMIVNQSEILAERRQRLSDISWWMRCTAENVARRPNQNE